MASEKSELAGLSPMPELLERAGFRIRSATRADCAKCSGRSSGAVSYTAEVAHCFRCDWRANTVSLARELGLLSADPALRARLREETRRRRRFDAEISRFDAWRETQLRHVCGDTYALSRAAIRASAVLHRDPDCEVAWDAVARWYHSEAQLSAAFDFLSFAKASAWLETDSTPAEIFEIWRDSRAA